MEPEEQLEHLINMRQLGKELPPVVSGEMLSRLAAMESLAHLRQVEVPSKFAARLEGDLRRHVRDIAKKNSAVTMSRRRTGYVGHRFVIRQAWITGFGIAAVLLLACVSIVTVCAQSLPGDPLYSLKQSGHQFSLTLAKNSLEQGKMNIDQLDSALTDLTTVVNAGRDDSEIDQALSTVIAKTNDSRTAVANVPAGPEHEQVQHDLDHALSDEKRILSQLLTHVDWSVQVAFTQQLAKLGDTVPVITNVMMNRQSDGTVLITLSGTNFAQQTRLIINGQVKGTVIKTTSIQLIAVINQSDWSQAVYAVGVLGLDDTATQVMVNVKSGVNNQQRGGDHYEGNKSPIPIGTPRTDDGGNHATPVSTRTSGGHYSGSGGSDD